MMLDDALWAFTRMLPPVSAAWLDEVPRGRGPVGPGWPGRYAGEQGLAAAPAPDGGLLTDFGALRGPSLDPELVHPHVRTFYEHTARYELAVDARWNPLFRLGCAAFSSLWASRWGQLQLPLAATPLTNEIVAVGEHTFWVRRYVGTDRALYVTRYDVIRVDSEPDPCVRIVFPVPGGAWVVLFRAVIVGSGLLLTERGGQPGGPGLYLVPNGGPARYLAAFREEISVIPTPRGAVAEHTMAWWGYRFLTLAYSLPAAPAAAGATIA